MIERNAIGGSEVNFHLWELVSSCTDFLLNNGMGREASSLPNTGVASWKPTCL